MYISTLDIVLNAFSAIELRRAFFDPFCVIFDAILTCIYTDVLVRFHSLGGVYGSPSLAGSRPGALIAGTWAAMQYMGEDGYLESCRAIVGCAQTIVRSVRDEIPELYVLGSPPASCVAFGARDSRVNVLAVGDAMSTRGWHLNGLSKPAGLHMACTRLTVPVVDQFIADLKDCVREVKERQLAKGDKEGTMVVLYGLGNSSTVGPAMVEKVTTAFLDVLYKAEEQTGRSSAGSSSPVGDGVKYTKSTELESIGQKHWKSRGGSSFFSAS
ncbi:hypothetical protein EW145_g7117 [Phellinidium pouzarii]|uniref:Plant heme peroxidase family profile domain-containing protein n=1 Tax=Phellinidium pouzarii TaxID=167371 RepID=A0A4S4KTG5_9AGAM|nr:hypothetical protein EW145_g7117 [Phellinidium pouzarii]